MRQQTRASKEPAEKVVQDIRRATRKHYSAEEKIRIVLEGLRGEDSIAELCRREGIAQNLYYRWSKDFLEAGKKRLAGDTARAATSDEVHDLRREAMALKEADDLDAGLLVVVVGADLLKRLACAQQRNAAARQDTFLDRGAGRVHGVIDTVLALLHLNLCRATDADHSDAAGELGQSLLQLLPVVVRGSFLDLRLDLGNTRLDVGLLARATDDRGVFFVDHHLLGAPEY